MRGVDLPVAGRVRDLLVPVELRHALAVHGDDQLLAGDAAEHRLEVAGDAFHLERVLPVHRELMLDEDAAAGAERQPLDVVVLRRVGRHLEHLLRRRAHVAHREPADLARGGEVGLHQRRRHRQRAGDVVEAARRVVGGQERAGVHLERQQIANRVGVFGAVQAVQARRRQVRGRRRDRARLPSSSRATSAPPDPAGAHWSAASAPPAPCARRFRPRPRAPAGATGRADRAAGSPSSAARCGR